MATATSATTTTTAATATKTWPRNGSFTTSAKRLRLVDMDKNMDVEEVKVGEGGAEAALAGNCEMYAIVFRLLFLFGW